MDLLASHKVQVKRYKSFNARVGVVLIPKQDRRPKYASARNGKLPIILPFKCFRFST